MSQPYTHVRTHARRLARRFFEWLEPSSRAHHAPDDLLAPLTTDSGGATSAQTPRDWARQTSDTIPTYPPFRNGLPCVTAEQIVRSQDEMIRDIYRATGVTADLWRSLYLPIIYHYAGHAHLLPASETNHHRGAGGLFQHGLEAAYHAVRQVDGKDAGKKSAHKADAVERKKYDERKRFTTFCAALLHDTGKPISDMTVAAYEGGPIWNPLLEYLPEWAASNGVERYHIHWRKNRKERHEAVSAILLPKLMGHFALAWMHDSEEGALWVDLLSKSLVNYETGSNSVRDNAIKGDQISVREDLSKRGESGNDIGIPLERYMLHSCREMLFENLWTVNEKSSVIFVCKAPDEGIERPFAPGASVVVLLWPRAGEAIIARLAKNEVPGVPRDPNIVASMLIDRGLAVPARHSTENNPSNIPFWYMLPPANDKENGLGSADTAIVAAMGQKVLVLTHAEYLLDPVPPPSDNRLISAKNTESTPPAAPAPAASAGRDSSATSAPSSPKSAPRPQTPAPKASEFHTPRSEQELRAGQTPSPEIQPATLEASPPHTPGKDTSTPENISTATRILRALAMDIALQKRDVAMVVPAGNSAMLRFPQALEDFGYKPIDILKMLDEEGMIKRDPTNPEKMIQTLTLPGESKASKVVVLSEPGILAAPCLGISPSDATPEQIQAVRAYLTSIAASCSAGKFVAEKGQERGAGYWFLPAEWVIHHLRSWSDAPCPEWVLRHFVSGPGVKDAEGLSIRFKAFSE